MNIYGNGKHKFEKKTYVKIPSLKLNGNLKPNSEKSIKLVSKLSKFRVGTTRRFLERSGNVAKQKGNITGIFR